MTKLIRQILFPIIILTATVSLAYTFNLLDQIVHSELYNYGLQFSLEWASPYWNLLRIIQILLGVIAGFTVVNLIFTFRKYVYEKKPSVRVAPTQRPIVTVPSSARPFERQSTAPPKPSIVPPAPEPTMAPTVPQPQVSSATQVPTPLVSEIPGLIRCSHCGKAFTQPLRMLDFQGDRPRIVNICPFCNEIIPIVPRQDTVEQDKRSIFRRKNNNHVPKTVTSQQSS